MIIITISLHMNILHRYTFSYEGKTISIRPVVQLAEWQEGREVKIAPNLKLSSLQKPRHFEKMKVSCALHIISHSVSTGLQFMLKNGLVEKQLQKEFEDTAWFIELLNRWFDLMASRHAAMALSKCKPEKYHAANDQLKTVIDVFRMIRVGDGRWKPYQSGVILTTTSVRLLAEELLGEEEDKLSFLMTGRLTQDCLENLFSSLRARNSQPGMHLSDSILGPVE